MAGRKHYAVARPDLEPVAEPKPNSKLEPECKSECEPTYESTAEPEPRTDDYDDLDRAHNVGC